MALYTELKGPALDAHNKTVQKLKAKIKQEFHLTDDEIVVRPLRPIDLGFTKNYFDGVALGTAAGAAGWNNFINAQTIADARYVGICGIVHNESVSELNQIRITREGAKARYWHVDAVRNFENKTAYFDDPVTFDQNTSLTIEGYAVTASTIYDYAFLGVTVERRGLLVNP